MELPVLPHPGITQPRDVFLSASPSPLRAVHAVTFAHVMAKVRE